MTHTVTSVTHWAVAAGSLANPAVAGAAATGTFSGTNPWYCSFATALAAETAYGLALGAAGSTATAGIYAPVALQTRMNTATGATVFGPVLDSNPVFDSVAVGAASVELGLAVTKTATADQAKQFPGESYSTTLAFEFGNFADTTKIEAPYNLVMTLTGGTSRVQGAAPTTIPTAGYTWVKYPHTYENWVWTPTCTNTLFGIADATDATKNPKMNTPAPACTLVG